WAGRAAGPSRAAARSGRAAPTARSCWPAGPRSAVRAVRAVRARGALRSGRSLNAGRTARACRPAGPRWTGSTPCACRAAGSSRAGLVPRDLVLVIADGVLVDDLDLARAVVDAGIDLVRVGRRRRRENAQPEDGRNNGECRPARETLTTADLLVLTCSS